MTTVDGRITDDSIHTIVEMGIDKETAVKALESTNGNIEEAINYIFTGELNSCPTAETTNNASFSTIAANEEETASVNSSNDGASANDGDQTREDLSLDTIISQLNSKLNTDFNVIFKSDVNLPTVMLPPFKQSYIMQSYLSLFLYTLAYNFPYSPSFLTPVTDSTIATNNVDLNYDINWFKHNSHPFKPKHLLDTNANDNSFLDSHPQIIWQFQKMLSTIILPSHRNYISTTIFNDKVFYPGTIKALQKYDHLSDILNVFIKDVITDFSSCNTANSTALNKLLVTSSCYFDWSNITKKYERQSCKTYLLHFPYDEFDWNLYKMFNNLFIIDEEDFEQDQENCNMLENISYNFTIILDEEEHHTYNSSAANNNTSLGVEIPMEFYPQIYTEDILKNFVYKELLATRKQLLKEYNELSRELMLKYKSFQGKSIMSFLNTTLDYYCASNTVNKDSDNAGNELDVVASTLIDVKQRLSEKKKLIVERMNEIKTDLNNKYDINKAQLNPSILDALGGTANNNTNSHYSLDLENDVYLLRSVIINPFNYYVIDTSSNKTFATNANINKNNKWIHITITLKEPYIIRETGVEPQEVIDVVKESTKKGYLEYPIVLQYCQRGKLLENLKFKQKSATSSILQFNESDEVELLRENLQKNATFIDKKDQNVTCTAKEKETDLIDLNEEVNTNTIAVDSSHGEQDEDDQSIIENEKPVTSSSIL